MSVQNSLINSNIEDKSAEEELKEITKEIESMAPTEEQEEVHMSQDKPEKKSDQSTASTTARERRHDGDKKSQPKPQRERPPRFDRSTKRKGASDEGSKKEYAKHEESKKEKSRLSSKQSVRKVQ
jgi:hypothetical protein